METEKIAILETIEVAAVEGRLWWLPELPDTDDPDYDPDYVRAQIEEAEADADRLLCWLGSGEEVSPC